jgi:hypothetical protein
MDQELQRYYEDRISMTSTKAWADLMEDIREMLLATDKVSAARDKKDFLFKKGEVSMMNWMLNIAKVSEDAYEELKNAKDHA